MVSRFLLFSPALKVQAFTSENTVPSTSETAFKYKGETLLSEMIHSFRPSYPHFNAASLSPQKSSVKYMGYRDVPVSTTIFSIKTLLNIARYS